MPRRPRRSTSTLPSPWNIELANPTLTAILDSVSGLLGELPATERARSLLARIAQARMTMRCVEQFSPPLRAALTAKVLTLETEALIVLAQHSRRSTATTRSGASPRGPGSTAPTAQ
jgi:hypothetical protein